jgi:hypothetical protein
VGRTWQVDYTEKQPNSFYRSERFHHDYSVVGWEDVTVPAGTLPCPEDRGGGHPDGRDGAGRNATTGTRTSRYEDVLDAYKLAN